MSVLVYSTSTCPFCHKAKEYLEGQGVAYTDINVGEDQTKVQEMMDKSGQLGVPVLDINGTIIVGFNQAQIDEALAKAK